ncbi:hypothetical protein PISMIDRAFT_438142 [Pisolithus microcarpus 441]|uniref:Uncharacterized protein n=1 Tax=Pisolithus microcarpus 441 TaxID=765257 RepID=A0A0D0AC97_9AGAM|nr:hypothetical protein PISMIDRAFT_438142 [Pisolithus microcarpus 441]
MEAVIPPVTSLSHRIPFHFCGENHCEFWWRHSNLSCYISQVGCDLAMTGGSDFDYPLAADERGSLPTLFRTGSSIQHSTKNLTMNCTDNSSLDERLEVARRAPLHLLEFAAC